MLFRSDRKSTRLNSSHTLISYAVFCLKKKKSNQSRSYQMTSACYRLQFSQLQQLSNPSRTHLVFSLHNFLPAPCVVSVFFFFNDTATTEIYPLSLHDALPIYSSHTLISYAVFCLRDESVTG